MLLITRLGATRERGFPKPLGWKTIPYGPQSVGHCSLRGGRAGSLCRKSTGQGEGRLTHCSTPQGLETVLEDGGMGVGPRNPWNLVPGPSNTLLLFPLSCFHSVIGSEHFTMRAFLFFYNKDVPLTLMCYLAVVWPVCLSKYCLRVFRFKNPPLTKSK